jgi:hypothetical protein
MTTTTTTTTTTDRIGHDPGGHWSSGDDEWSSSSSSQLQTDLMEKDTVIVVDALDRVTGSASKKDAHLFDRTQPYGVLHRAFSVFVFDTSDCRMLLQQRAASKITFPNVRKHNTQPNHNPNATQQAAAANANGRRKHWSCCHSHSY